MRAVSRFVLMSAMLALTACSTTNPDVITSAVQPTNAGPPPEQAPFETAAPTPEVQPAPQAIATTKPSPNAEQALANSPPVNIASSAKLQTPLAGSIIAPFGPAADGTHNDGINIAAQLGAEIHAAEAAKSSTPEMSSRHTATSC
jgi:murein DD-endopeptidase MepM/ murein hydrolase activator NlpD